MAYLAIARKWRPNRFEDLIGQEHVVQTLQNALRLDRVSHAYLFSGARGVGKTTVARIFAKALRCPNQKDGTPCNTCNECTAISEGRSVDVAEIDGASHNGVEAVRSIRDSVSYSPSFGKYKVYIIDEVHMLSISAFNALLKTLEEPPPHVVFLFATTEVQKIPLTILSRCQRFDFRRLRQRQIVGRLQHILAAENVRISEKGLATIASYADGSLRDALSLLDQVLSHQPAQAGQELSEDTVTQALGVATSSSVSEWVAAVVRHKPTEALSILDAVYRSGIDLKAFAERGLEEIRLIYLLVIAQESSQKIDAEYLDIAPSQLDQFSALAQGTKRLELERAAQILSRAISQMGLAHLPRFVLEMASVRICLLEGLQQIEDRLLATKAASSTLAQSTQVHATSQHMHPQPARVAPTTAPAARPAPAPRPAGIAPATPVSAQAQAERPMPPPPGASGNFQGFIDFAMKKRPLVGALLGHAECQIDPSKKVTLKFAQGSFYERQASDPHTKQSLEDLLKSFYGPSATLHLTSAGADQVQSPERSMQEQTEAIKKSALEHPTVLQMKEMLGAEVVDVNVDL